MVSAVFHSPLEASRELALQKKVLLREAPAGAAADPAGLPTPIVARACTDWRDLGLRVLPPAIGFGLLIGVWALLTKTGGAFPTPAETAAAAWKLFADPFYRNGPNDQGIGWNILNSLYRVGIGFGLAAAIGIPLGFMIGRFAFLNQMLSPIISLLRPVSPLAWLPIGLLVLQKAEPASIWVIFISSIWPMVLNTAAGVQRIPQDYMNVARVLNLSEFKVFTKILFPAVLPYMLTGVRLSIGVAWLVIVAAEMLTGGPPPGSPAAASDGAMKSKVRSLIDSACVHWSP